MSFETLDVVSLLVTLVFFGILWYLDNKKQLDFGLLTLLATGLGVISGLIFREHYSLTVLFGRVYVNVLNAFVIPLLLFSVISSITNLGNSIHLQKIGLKSVLFLLLNTLTASVLALVAALALNLGKGFNYAAEAYEPKEVPDFLDTLVGLFPKNIISSWSDGQVIPILIFGIILAVAYNASIKDHPEVSIFKKFVDATAAVINTALGFIIDLTPYAVLSLIARAVGRAKVSDLLPLLTVLIVAYVLCIIQTFGVNSLALSAIGHLNPIHFFKGTSQAGIVAFTSQSSVGTLPVTVSNLEKLGVNGDVASFTAGLGANLGMPGCAGIWPMLLAVFAVHMLGIQYTPAQYAFLVLLTLVVSIGTVGVPGTATITATALFTAAGLPIEVIVIFSPISMIVDMARTATNVLGAAEASVLVAKTEGLLNEAAYNAVDTANASSDYSSAKTTHAVQPSTVKANA